MILKNIFANSSLLLVLLIPVISHSAPGINMGLLNPYLSEGNQGAWNIKAEKDSVLLENKNTSGDISYYFVNSKPEEEGHREISVSVELLKSGSNSWAGLLYGYKEKPKRYYLFVLQGGDTVSLYHRTDAGIKLRSSMSFNGDPSKPIHLAIREKGNKISLLVNGRETSSFGNDSIGKGAVGIVAADIGLYRFSGFKVKIDKGNKKTKSESKKALKDMIADSGQAAVKLTAKTQIIEEFDPKLGMVAMRMEIPADWKKPSNPNLEKNGLKILYKSSDGVIVYQNQSRISFFPSGDPMRDQTFRMLGNLVENYQPLEQLVKQLLAPSAKKLGAKFIKGYKVPELLDFHRQEVMDGPWYTYHFDSYGTEWDLGDGLRSAVLVVQIIGKPTQRTLNNSISGKDSAMNMLIIRGIEAPNAIFKKARDTFIASVANIEINAVWKQASYQSNITKMTQIEAKGKADLAASQRAHNARMRNRAAAQATQTQIGKTYSDILDINHSGYTTQSKIKYAGHKSSINGIQERAIIYNNNLGTNYSVRAGSKHYWVNPANGEYIGTDNPLFDPRINNNISGQWEQFKIKR